MTAKDHEKWKNSQTQPKRTQANVPDKRRPQQPKPGTVVHHIKPKSK